MSGEKYVTGGDVIVVTRILREICRRFKNKVTTDHLIEFIEKVQKEISERFDKIEQSGTFSLSKSRIQIKVQDMIAKEMKQSHNAEVATSLQPEPGSRGNDMAMCTIFDNFMEKISEDVDFLTRLDKSGKNSNPGEWWLSTKHIYPNLAQIYRSSCNIVATSVPCERMFRKTG
ncbi:hypothetical protein WA026_023172 [Henosepilachna vigintioctopunctata]|uniref:HAT C-terminal dimerisation domain-containing protein n=1 Tax=Henosepilachna vigintioctopunctata TaxID=420089 RepID=A0AAW1UP02_9CUCU